MGRRSLLASGAALLAAGGLGGVEWHDRAAGPSSASADAAARQGIQAALDRRAAAVRARNSSALAATLLPGAQGLRDTQLAMLGNLAQVPIGSWAYRVQALDAYPLPAVLGAAGGADARRAVQVELTYRLSGYDTEPVTATQYQTFSRAGTDGDWLLSSDTDHPGGTVQLWDLGAVTAVHGRSSLVLGLRGRDILQQLADQADAAIPVVNGVWGDHWGGHTVLLAPLGLDQFGQLLGVDPRDFTAIAAVTTGELGASEAGRTERITVNPQVWDGLNALGRRVVITHETTHVATRAETEQWTPRWLAEGVANWTGYLGTGQTPQQIAPELLADIAAGRVPAQLPDDAAFDGTATGLAQAYEQAWFACRTVVLRHGQPALVALYRAFAATGGRGGQDAVADTALRAATGTGLTAFTAQWRADLLAAAGTPTAHSAAPDSAAASPPADGGH